VYPASEVIRPGVIRVIEGNRFTLGEIDGSDTPSMRVPSATPSRQPASRRRYRATSGSEIWLKLWGNLSFNPISALTHATLEDICRFGPWHAGTGRRHDARGPDHRRALGVQFKVSLEKRIAGAQAVGQHKTSMLQDVEAGRPLELQALVGASCHGTRTSSPRSRHPPSMPCHALTSLLANYAVSNGKATVYAWLESQFNPLSEPSNDPIMTTPFTTLSEMIARPDALTPLAMHRPLCQAPELRSALNALDGPHRSDRLNGLGYWPRGPRCACVLPNCPEMATAFVAVAGCVHMPLRSTWPTGLMSSSSTLSDLNAKALIVAQRQRERRPSCRGRQTGHRGDRARWLMPERGAG
jgi:hypothetical protein